MNHPTPPAVTRLRLARAQSAIRGIKASQQKAVEAEDVHPREDAVRVIHRALAYLDCNAPVDPYDPDDIDSVACEAVWALIRAGLLSPTTPADAGPLKDDQ